MPVYRFDALKKEYVTPQHSTAFGSLVTGEQIEIGMLRYKAGEGAKEHAHPCELASATASEFGVRALKGIGL
jgi:hypothetical protein